MIVKLSCFAVLRQHLSRTCALKNRFHELIVRLVTRTVSSWLCWFLLLVHLLFFSFWFYSFHFLIYIFIWSIGRRLFYSLLSFPLLLHQCLDSGCPVHVLFCNNNTFRSFVDIFFFNHSRCLVLFLFHFIIIIVFFFFGFSSSRLLLCYCLPISQWRTHQTTHH